MKEKELIQVFIRCEHGKTVCICHAARKRCGRNCERDQVTRDRYDKWEETMKRDRYGK